MKVHLTGIIEHATLLGFRCRAAEVRHLLPAGLRLVQRDGFAFWNIAFGQLVAVRPLGVPAALGLSYAQIAYRLLTEADLDDGTTQRGLFFVRSDADARTAVIGGNAFTDFRLHTADIQQAHERQHARIAAQSTDLAGCVSFALCAADAPETVPQPADPVSCEELGHAVHRRQLHTVRVRRHEPDWTPQHLQLESFRVGLFDALQLNVEPTIAIRVPRVRYRWTLGQRAAIATLPHTLAACPA